MRQSQNVRPLSSIQVSQPSENTQLRRSSPQASRKRQERDKSAPPRTVVERLLAAKGKAEEKSENGLEAKMRENAVESAEEYKTVPISYTASVAAASAKATKLTKPSTKRVSSSIRSRSSVRTRQPSLDSELPLTQDTLKNPPSGQVCLSFESDVKGSSKLSFPWFVSKNPSESCITVVEEGSGEHRMKDSLKARMILMSTDVKPAILSMATSVPVCYPELDLSEQDLHDEDLTHILRLLEVYPFATHLDLFGNKLTFSNCQGVTFGKGHAALQWISLSKNKIGPLASYSTLGQFLTSFSSLSILDLEACGLSDDDLFRLGADISVIRSLKQLNLRSNLITNGIALVLGQILDSNSSIETVDLSLTHVTSALRSTLSRHKRKLIVNRGRRCCKWCLLM